MGLPSTGQISMEMVNTELKKGARDRISLNDTNVRKLANKPSGTISMADLRGKSSAEVYTLTIENDSIMGVFYGYSTDFSFGDMKPNKFMNSYIKNCYGTVVLDHDDSSFICDLFFNTENMDSSKKIKISILNTDLSDILTYHTIEGFIGYINESRGKSKVAKYIYEQYDKNNYNIQLTIEYVN